MRRLVKLVLRHPTQLLVVLILLCALYGYTRVLVLQYTIGALLYWIHRYPRNFPHGFFLPLFYTSLTMAFFAAIYHDLVVLPSGSWKYVLPLPMTVRGRMFRIVGVPLYACVIGIAEAVQMFRNPSMKSDLSQLAAYLKLMQDHSFLDDSKIRAIILDVKWNAWMLKTTDPSTFAYIRLPIEISLAVTVCALYSVSLFCSEPRHDGEELREATRNNDIGRVRRLLVRGVDVNSQGSDGATALHICAQQAMGGIAKHLLDHKADANIMDRLGFTPLHWAVQLRREEVSTENRLEIIRLLVAQGADAWKGDGRGRTALKIAQKAENSAALAVLRDVLGDSIDLPEETSTRGEAS